MYICIYVYMYVCMYVCMYVYIYIYIYICCRSGLLEATQAQEAVSTAAPWSCDTSRLPQITLL